MLIAVRVLRPSQVQSANPQKATVTQPALQPTASSAYTCRSPSSGRNRNRSRNRSSRRQIGSNGRAPELRTASPSAPILRPLMGRIALPEPVPVFFRRVRVIAGRLDRNLCDMGLHTYRPCLSCYYVCCPEMLGVPISMQSLHCCLRRSWPATALCHDLLVLPRSYQHQHYCFQDCMLRSGAASVDCSGRDHPLVGRLAGEAGT